MMRNREPIIMYKCIEPVSLSIAVTYIIHKIKEKMDKELENKNTKIEQRRQLEYLLYKIDKLHDEYQTAFRENEYSNNSPHLQNLVDHIKATQEVYYELNVKYEIYDAKLSDDTSQYDKYEESLKYSENNPVWDKFIQTVRCICCMIF